MDLNLLVALDALLQEESVSRAAARLHLSPPAMSRTLARLRDAVGDPLLVRAGRILVPTPRAVAMRENTRTLVDAARALLQPADTPPPRELRRTFSIRINDGATTVLAPPLLKRIAEGAPGVRLRFVAEGDVEDASALRDGQVDLDIGVQGPLGPEVRVQTLFEEHLVMLVRRGGALSRGKLTLSRFAAAEHVISSRRGKLRDRLDEILEKHGQTRIVRAVVATQLAAAALVAQSDFVAMVNVAFARTAARILPVTSRALPLKLQPIVIAQAWHPRFDADPAHAWLRAQLRELFAGKRHARMNPSRS